MLLRLAVAGTAVIASACSLLPPDPFPRSALQSGLDRLVETQAASAAMLRIREGNTSGRREQARKHSRRRFP
jgi:hypothetical protein